MVLAGPLLAQGIPDAVGSSRTAAREKFESAVAKMDDLVRAKRTNKLDVDDVFREGLPQSKRISDHIVFFRDVGRDPIRVRANNKNYIYFEFSSDDLRKLGARHVVRGDRLVINYVASDLSDDAEILTVKATLVNGSAI